MAAATATEMEGYPGGRRPLEGHFLLEGFWLLVLSAMLRALQCREHILNEPRLRGLRNKNVGWGHPLKEIRGSTLKCPSSYENTRRFEGSGK